MPTLKQLTCHVEWAPTNIPFKEYGVTYGDGIVESYIAIPSSSTPFSISLRSNGFIAPGLAMFVYMDGVYQCNRSRDNLTATDDKGDKLDTKRGKEKEARQGVSFRVRQKEEMQADGKWVGREWRFEPLQIIPAIPGMPEIGPKSHFDHLGDIMVIVLRCRPRDGRAAALSDRSLTPESTMAPSGDPNDIDAARSDEELEIAKSIFRNMDPEPQLNANSQSESRLGDLGMLFDGANDRYRPSGQSRRQRHHHAYTGEPNRHRSEHDGDYCTDCNRTSHVPESRRKEHSARRRMHSNADSDSHAHQSNYNREQSETDDDCSSCAEHQHETAHYSAPQHSWRDNHHDRHATSRRSRRERERSASQSLDYEHRGHEARPTRLSTRHRHRRHGHGAHERTPSSSSELANTEYDCSKCAPLNREPPARQRSRVRLRRGHEHCEECNFHNTDHLGPNDPYDKQTTHSRKRQEEIVYGRTAQTTPHGAPSIVLNVNPPSCAGEYPTCKTRKKRSNDSESVDNGCYLISNGKRVPHHCKGPRTQAPNGPAWKEDHNHNDNWNAERDPSPGIVQHPSWDEPNGGRSSGTRHGSNTGSHKHGEDNWDRGRTAPNWNNNGSQRSRNGSIGGKGMQGNWAGSNSAPQNWRNNDENRSRNEAQDDWANAGNGDEPRSNQGDPGCTKNNSGYVNNNDWEEDNRVGDNNGNGLNNSQWDSENVGNTTNEAQQQDAWSNHDNNGGGDWNHSNQDNGQYQQEGNWASNGGNESGSIHNVNNSGQGQWASDAWSNKDNNRGNNEQYNANEQSNAQPIPPLQQPCWVPMQSYRVVTPNHQRPFATHGYYDPQNDEPPLYTVPEAVAQAESLTHQVQPGRAEEYIHKLRVPEYLDTMEEPYAKFIFKYRMQDLIEQKFNVKVERDPEVERKKLEMLPKSDIVNQLLQAQGFFNNQSSVNPVVPVQPDPPHPEYVHYGAFGNAQNQGAHTYWQPASDPTAQPPPPVAGPPGTGIRPSPIDSSTFNDFNIDGASGNSNYAPLPLHSTSVCRHPLFGHGPRGVMKPQSQSEIKSSSPSHDRQPSTQSESARRKTSSGNNRQIPKPRHDQSSGDPFRNCHSGNKKAGAASAGDPFQSKHARGSARNGSGLSSASGDPFQNRHGNKPDNHRETRSADYGNSSGTDGSKGMRSNRYETQGENAAVDW
ncbi:hypothetical protein PRK78_004007 [Emydomyces testavorans]|uniref:Uncharacterized protein n=1 Tax=Emydomyces testavorans TaxID=2070801 RepID=A0AAF0DH27_9EURO|nr:hypothetical protein PRK78_004007 [Emydomyces testavorans]